MTIKMTRASTSDPTFEGKIARLTLDLRRQLVDLIDENGGLIVINAWMNAICSLATAGPATRGILIDYLRKLAQVLDDGYSPGCAPTEDTAGEA